MHTFPSEQGLQGPSLEFTAPTMTTANVRISRRKLFRAIFVLYGLNMFLPLIGLSDGFLPVTVKKKGPRPISEK